MNDARYSGSAQARAMGSTSGFAETVCEIREVSGGDRRNAYLRLSFQATTVTGSIPAVMRCLTSIPNSIYQK
jgi:hypothetical protein